MRRLLFLALLCVVVLVGLFNYRLLWETCAYSGWRPTHSGFRLVTQDFEDEPASIARPHLHDPEAKIRGPVIICDRSYFTNPCDIPQEAGFYIVGFKRYEWLPGGPHVFREIDRRRWVGLYQDTRQ